MIPNELHTTTNTAIIDDSASLQKFYLLTNQLSKHRKVRFTGKLDEADNIEWNFKYRGYPLTLQYNIYNGVSLTPFTGKESKDAKVVNEVVVILKGKRA